MGTRNKTLSLEAKLTFLNTGPPLYLILGFDVGGFSNDSKLDEFNKVLAPNKFSFAPDSSSIGTTSGLDFGLGVAYAYSGFTFGLGFSRLNNPAIHPSPSFIAEVDPADSTKNRLKDTTVVLDRVSVGVQTDINMVYEWQPNGKLSIVHSLHVTNLDGTGADYIGLQNIAEIKKRHSIGLGGFYNGSYGFNATLGFGFTEDIKIQASAFFIKDFNYDVSQRTYIDDGYKPLLEANIRYEF